MNTLKFEYNGKEYDVPVKWQTYEWWMQFFDLKEAKKAQKAFRKFCIELENAPQDPHVEDARQEMFEIRSQIIAETRQYLRNYHSLENKDHVEYISRMEFLKDRHDARAMICGGSIL